MANDRGTKTARRDWPDFFNRVSDEILNKLIAMAEEEEISEVELINKLILGEDRKRHVVKVPFAGDARVKCLAFHSRCAEKQDCPTARDYEEI